MLLVCFVVVFLQIAGNVVCCYVVHSFLEQGNNPSRDYSCSDSGQGRWDRRRGLDRGGIDGVHIVVLDQVAQCLPVFSFVVPDVDEDVVKGGQFRTPLAVGSLFVLVLDGAKEIKEEGVVQLVVPAGHLGNRQVLQAFLVGRRELAVGVKGVVLDELRQMVGGGLVPGVDDNDVPVIPKGHGLCKGPIDNVRISAQAFHDQQVVEFVVGLGVVGSHPTVVEKDPQQQKK